MEELQFHKTPLAERMRPATLDELLGQPQLSGPQGILRQALELGNVPSMILWGPPGVGKTTLAGLIALSLGRPFHTLSAISAGVREVRDILHQAGAETGAILFIDEIHRFNKGQQDALLQAVERGIVTLIGATTENPSFEINAALLSRCQVYVLQPLGEADLLQLAEKALREDTELSGREIRISEHEALLSLSGGDARKLLNLLELLVDAAPPGAPVLIDNARVIQVAQKRVSLYDKKGEQHYDIVSAFIKSVRGSDPNAAVYWLARMIEGGEDLSFIARRMVILASEDIGNANPTALVLATSTFQAVNLIGYPEARIILSQCATYLAGSPKSNASYRAIAEAQSLVASHGDLPVPLHLRNAPTRLMKDLGYHEGYTYSHDYDGNFSGQEYLPEALSGTRLYEPGRNPREEELRRFLKSRWKDKYGY